MNKFTYGIFFFMLLSACVPSQTGNREVVVEKPIKATYLNKDAIIASPQLYQTSNQNSLPILQLNRNSTLTLAFDWLDEGKNLSIYFYHMNKDWKKDLIPPQYMKSFDRDDIYDFSYPPLSDFNFAHYEYKFPNERIGFILSGNYMLRVTEVGRENTPLLEMPFMVAEDLGTSNYELDGILYGNSAWPLVQPIIKYQPPKEIENEYFNFKTCFFQQSFFMDANCQSKPYLALLPEMEFKTDPSKSFQVMGDLRSIDLSIIAIGGRIDEVDYSVIPNAVELDLDFAQLSSASQERKLVGQPIYKSSGRNVGNSAYVNVLFQFVPPDEQKLTHPIYIRGSFNQWRSSQDTEMTWNDTLRRYQKVLMLKQGIYQYQYISDDIRMTDSRSKPNFFTPNLFSALVYYHDDYYNSDRIIKWQSMWEE